MGLPEPAGEADPRGAVQLLLDEMDCETTLLTLGPLTNVAEALRRDPDLAERVPIFLSMAGAIDVDGNAPNGVAEYNVWVDPLAAKEAFEQIPVTLVPLDATNDVSATPFFLQALDEHRGTPESEAVFALMDGNEIIFSDPGYSLWDTLTSVLLLDPEIATWGEVEVLVTASEDAGAGWIDRYEGGTPVASATGVPDRLAFEREYLSTLTGQEVTDVLPEATFTVVFDGERCAVEPSAAAAGDHVFGFEDRSEGTQGTMEFAIVVGFTSAAYDDLATLLGPPGSPIPKTEPKGLEVLAWLESGSIGQASLEETTYAAVCLQGSEDVDRGWLSEPITIGS